MIPFALDRCRISAGSPPGVPRVVLTGTGGKDADMTDASTAAPGVPRTVADLVTRAASRTPHRLAIVDGPRRVSWTELRERMDAITAGFRAAGLSAGDRVALQLPTGLDLVELYLAALQRGLIVVPVNPAYTRPELAAVLADSGARVLFTSSVDALSAATELTTGPLEAVVAVRFQPLEKLAGSNAGTPLDGTRSLADFLAPILEVSSEPEAPAESEIDSETVAVLLYTSGTSGRPKGAMLTHRALLANITQGTAIKPSPATANDIFLVPIPLFHIYGLNAGLGLALAHGSAVVLVDRFDVAGTLRLLTEEGVTVVMGAPAMFAAWSRSPDFAAAFAGVRFALSGSAPLSPALVDLYAGAGVPLHEGYGLTEAAPVVTSNAADRDGNSRLGRPKAGSVGAPLPGVEISLRDSTGAPVEENDPGLIAVRGANLFSGYWPDGAGGPDGDGWFVTGDLGYLDSESDLILVGRDSDLVIVNGFNVYPAEVETVLVRLAGVAEAAVIGVPDEATGEAVVAYVVPKPGSQLDPQELLAGAAGSLARFKLPRRVEIVDALPHTVTGKVKKWQLRERS
ncbi:MAG: AMP-dependent synthetase and ligase [Pseudonocardiales bacterium]|nr:AMP-dependent synthetase and ligase [Pseudonocardiales bacterium]